MEEIKIYLDRDRNQQINSEIIFDEVVAGEVIRQSIFIENAIQYPMEINLVLEGEDVVMIRDVKSIQPGVLEEVEFEFTPQLTAMVPIKAKLNIKLNYVVR